MTRWFLTFVLLCLGTTVNAKQTLRLAVFAYNPDIMMLARYQPIVNELEARLPGMNLELNIVSASALEANDASRQYDVMLVDPAHFLKLREHNKLSGALLTLRRGIGNRSTSLLGGVMIARTAKEGYARADMEGESVRLSNLSHIPIAVVATDYLETYIAQEFELKSLGHAVPSKENLVYYQDSEQVVDAVLKGQQKVGFIRTGVLESMQAEGNLNIDDIRVLNSQELSDYPFLVSTKLYPEWAFVAQSHVDPEVVRVITAAFLNYSGIGEYDHQVGFYGFVPALDYLPVEQVLKELNIAPYDESSVWGAFFHRYGFYFLLINVAAMLLILASWYTYRQNKYLARMVKKEKEAQALLAKSNKQLDVLLSSSPTVIYSLEPEKFQIKFISSNCKALYGKSASQVRSIPNWWQNSIHEDDLSRVLGIYRQWRLDGFQGTLIFSYRIARGDEWVWIEDRLQALRAEDGSEEIVLLIGAHSDISQRKYNEEQLELSASVFANAREGIAITTPEGDILDVNDAFSRITGYAREEIIGKNPRVLNSGRQSKEFYQEMWHQIIHLGFWEGEVWNKRKDGTIYAQNLTVASVRDSEGRVSHYISLFSDITRQKKNEEQLEHIAYFDALTGLPNRTNLTSSLDQKIHQVDEKGGYFALAFLDLDGFKEVNDTFGHDTGDLLLVEVAKRMRETLGEMSIVSRFGGDEFVLLVPIEPNITGVEEILYVLLDHLSQPFRVSGALLHISASIGVTYYPQDKSVEADQLIRQADQAMYQAKITGRNRLKVFNLSQETILVEQHRFYEELQEAYDKEEFCLYYQPKVNMRTREVIGYEALIRWDHPEHGILGPAAFLPALTNQPLELLVGHWVLKTAIAQIDQWQKQGYTQGVSVNLAAFQLQQPSFISELQRLLSDYPASVAEALELEILETSAIEDLATVSAVIEACKKMGISISLDDFGTGYSTLSHLKELSVDILKIDHGFVREMLRDSDDLAIIKGVIGFADAFSLKVIAEGVETIEHVEHLLELGCELGQGYCISRPMPAQKVPSWYDEWSNLECDLVECPNI